MTEQSHKTGSRLKLVLLLAGVAFSGLALLSWTQPWFELTLVDSQSLSVTGEIAAPALTALALTGLVLVGALAIAGPFFRVVLGSLQALLGFTVGYSAVLAILNPVVASGAAVTTATGVSGDLLVNEVSSFSSTAWPWFAVAAGALLILTGFAVVATAKRWPGTGRKYQAVRVAPADGPRSSVDDWDALSGGNDPTS
jgi:uncharacterized membrane protein (TIGR02234 family)